MAGQTIHIAHNQYDQIKHINVHKKIYKEEDRQWSNLLTFLPKDYQEQHFKKLTCKIIMDSIYLFT